MEFSKMFESFYYDYPLIGQSLEHPLSLQSHLCFPFSECSSVDFGGMTPSCMVTSWKTV